MKFNIKELRFSTIYKRYEKDRRHWDNKLTKEEFKEVLQTVFAKISQRIIWRGMVYEFPVIGGKYYIKEGKRPHKKDLYDNGKGIGIDLDEPFFLFHVSRSDFKNRIIKEFYETKTADVRTGKYGYKVGSKGLFTYMQQKKGNA